MGKAEEVLPEQFARTGERADVIVVDPPRKGCDETLLSTIIEMQPDRGSLRKLRQRNSGTGFEVSL